MNSAGHAERAHALLSASSAARWMACTPSAVLESPYPDKTSVYAEEGTRAHEIAEEVLRRWQEGKRRLAYKDDDLRIYEEVSPYIDYVKNHFEEAKKIHADTVLFLESRFDLTEYIPEGFGTGDAVLIYGKTIEVIDLKFGKGDAVSALENPQLRLYGVGALLKYQDIYDFDEVIMSIVQPRIDNNSSEVLSVQELIQWVEEVCSPKARIAFKGEGELASGPHCHYCRHYANCKLPHQQALSIVDEKAIEEVKLMANVLGQVDVIRKFLDAVESKATELLLEGVEIPGYKLVEGRANRKYTDEDTVVEVLKKKGYLDAQIYEKKVYGITAMEKNIGKKIFQEMLGNCVYKPQGKPTIAPASDKREPYSSVALDFAGIE